MNKTNCFELPSHFSRREFLHVGLVGGLGLTLADFLKIKAHGAQKFMRPKEGPAKSVIHIYLPGGMAHQESWDPKPYAPLEYRGPFRSIPTKILVFTSAKTLRSVPKLLTRSLFAAP